MNKGAINEVPKCVQEGRDRAEMRKKARKFQKKQRGIRLEHRRKYSQMLNNATK